MEPPRAVGDVTYHVSGISGGRLACSMAALAVSVVETPSEKDAIGEGLFELLKPAVQQLDLHVHSVR